jgi:hypothetical protein
MKSCVGEERKSLSYANSPQSNNHSLALSLSLSLSLTHTKTSPQLLTINSPYTHSPSYLSKQTQRHV